MRHRLAGVLYLVWVLVLCLVHDPRWLALGFVPWTLIAGAEAPGLLRRALLAVLLFSGTVSLSMVAVGWWRGDVDVAWLVRTNLRVLLITATTLLAVRRIDLHEALAPWPMLLSGVAVAGAQVRLLQREWQDLRLGLRSRSLERPAPRIVARHAASSGAQFLGRALHDAEEISLAMQARGAWIDRRP